MIRQLPEQLLEKLSRAKIIRIRDGGPSWMLFYPRVNEFSVTAAETVDDFTERWPLLPDGRRAWR